MRGSGDYVSLRDIADKLQVSERTLARWCLRGYLPGAKYGGQWRVRRADFEAWVAQHHIVHAQPSGDAIQWQTSTIVRDHRSSTHKFEREMRYAALALDREIDEKLNALQTRRKGSG